MKAEVDEIMGLLAQRGDVDHLLKCFKPSPPPMRSLEFVAAIRAYDWTLAASLATTDDERQVLPRPLLVSPLSCCAP